MMRCGDRVSWGSNPQGGGRYLLWLAAMADLVVSVDGGLEFLGAESISFQHHPSLKMPLGDAPL